ncbi:MAG: hypothetical protein LBH24_03425 [Clostridiales bacterium]|jgi:hypothetical protein|nr:hypothetical protein [Clostridiales bacterium]
MILDRIHEDLERNEKSTPSAKLHTNLQIVSALGSVLLLLVSFVLFFVDEDIWRRVFGACLYPIVILLILSFYCGIAQIFRQRLKRNLLFLIVALLCVAAVVGTVIYEVGVFGAFYIPPFN